MIASGKTFHTRLLSLRERFQRVSDDYRAAQPRLLDEIVRVNADTVFGRAHGFAAIRSIDDYRRAVPLREHDGFDAWIERMAEGEQRVLTADPPVLFRRSSGTTSASKKLPVTARSLDTDMAMVHLGHGLPVLRFPEILTRRNAVLNLAVNPWFKAPVETRSGVKWQSYSEHCAMFAEAGGSLYGTPGTDSDWHDAGELLSVADANHFRLRLAVEADLLGIMSVNPSTIVAIATQLAGSIERIIRELRDGTVLGARRREPNPGRARELERLAEKGTVLPRDVWPNLKYAQSWQSASCALYQPQLQELLGAAVEFIPFHYCASEGVGMVHLDQHPLAGYFLPDGVLYEFIPAETEATAHAQTLLLEELELGREYQIVHSAHNGLYRYLIGDLFRVDALVHGVPRLEYVGRKGVFSSFTGEKITERHVLDTMMATAQALGVRLVNFTCFPRWGNPPHYAFAVEPATTAGPELAARLAVELERQLVEHNDEYPSKRSSNRLGPVEVHLVGTGGFVRFRERLLESGTASPTQLKDKPLQKDDALLATLLGL